MNADRLSGILFLLISGFMYVYSMQYLHLSSFFPKVVAVLMGVFALALLVKSFVSPEKREMFTDIDRKYLAIFVLGLVLYVLIIPVVGFLPTSIIFISLFCWFLSQTKRNKRTIITSLAIGIGVSSVFYSVFKFIFLVPLPPGVLFGG